MHSLHTIWCCHMLLVYSKCLGYTLCSVVLHVECVRPILLYIWIVNVLFIHCVVLC